MDIFNIYYICVGIISFIFFLTVFIYGGYKPAAVFVVLIGIMHFMLAKLRTRWMQLNREHEEVEKIKSRLDDTHHKLNEKSHMLSEKIAESNIRRRITQAMISTMELSRILGIILEAVVKTLSHERATLLLLDEDERNLQVKQVVGLSVSKLDGLKVECSDEDNPFMRSMKEARPLIIRNAHQYKYMVPFLTGKNGEFPHEIVISPLIAKDKVVGLVLVDHLQTKRPFQEEDLRNLLSYTQQAGMAVLNARLYQTEKHFNEELSKEVEKARKKLLDAQAKLIQSERLAALGEMAAVVAHEVKNPMASIKACAQTIEQSIKRGTRFDQKYLYYIMKEVDRLDKIVRSILTFSKPSVPRLVLFDLNILIEETLDFMHEEFSNEGVKIKKSLRSDLPRIMIDPEQTKQVLINLLGNSLFFLKNKKQKIITVVTVLSNTCVRLSVEDTGGGIDPKIVHKIFEPFFTTKTQGTGLGLAICHKIVESQKGTIEVHNRPGIGTRMDILFPEINNNEKNTVSRR